MLPLLLGLTLAAEPLPGGVRVPSVSPESTVATRAMMTVDGQGAWVQQSTLQGRAVVQEKVGFSAEYAGAVASLDRLRAWPGRLVVGLDGFLVSRARNPKATVGGEFSLAPLTQRGAWADRARDTISGGHAAMRFALAPGPDERVLLRWAVGIAEDPFDEPSGLIGLKPLVDFAVAYAAPLTDRTVVLTEAELLVDYSPFHLRLVARTALGDRTSLDLGGHLLAGNEGDLAVGPVLQLVGRP